MATVWQASVEDLYRVEGKAELVGGVIVRQGPGTGLYGIVKGNIQFSLHAYSKQTGRGQAYGATVGFLCDLPHRRSFCADCSYYTGPRAGREFLPQPPDFAVEIRYNEDYGPAAEIRLADKRADYFAAGTQVVWDVDLLSEDVVRVFRQSEPTTPQIYRRDEVAEAEPAVPGWTFAVSELFE